MKIINDFWAFFGFFPNYIFLVKFFKSFSCRYSAECKGKYVCLTRERKRFPEINNKEENKNKITSGAPRKTSTRDRDYPDLEKFISDVLLFFE